MKDPGNEVASDHEESSDGGSGENEASQIVVEFSLLCCTSMAHVEILRYGRK